MNIKYTLDYIQIARANPGDITFKLDLDNTTTIRDDIGQPIMSYEKERFWVASLDDSPLEKLYD